MVVLATLKLGAARTCCRRSLRNVAGCDRALSSVFGKAAFSDGRAGNARAVLSTWKPLSQFETFPADLKRRSLSVVQRFWNDGIFKWSCWQRSSGGRAGNAHLQSQCAYAGFCAHSIVQAGLLVNERSPRSGTSLPFSHRTMASAYMPPALGASSLRPGARGAACRGLLPLLHSCFNVRFERCPAFLERRPFQVVVLATLIRRCQHWRGGKAVIRPYRAGPAPATVHFQFATTTRSFVSPADERCPARFFGMAACETFPAVLERWLCRVVVPGTLIPRWQRSQCYLRNAVTHQDEADQATSNLPISQVSALQNHSTPSWMVMP